MFCHNRSLCPHDEKKQSTLISIYKNLRKYSEYYAGVNRIWVPLLFASHITYNSCQLGKVVDGLDMGQVI